LCVLCYVDVHPTVHSFFIICGLISYGYAELKNGAHDFSLLL
jgi:hypothetical protein